MKMYRHVYRMGAGFVFRLSLPGHRFVSTEIFETEELGAFYADVFKLYLSSTYRLTGATFTRSLAPSRFREILAEAGGPEALSGLLLASCREYLQLGGDETLRAYVAAQTEINEAVL